MQLAGGALRRRRACHKTAAAQRAGPLLCALLRAADSSAAVSGACSGQRAAARTCDPDSSPSHCHTVQMGQVAGPAGADGRNKATPQASAADALALALLLARSGGSSDLLKPLQARAHERSQARTERRKLRLLSCAAGVLEGRGRVVH